MKDKNIEEKKHKKGFYEISGDGVPGANSKPVGSGPSTTGLDEGTDNDDLVK